MVSETKLASPTAVVRLDSGAREGKASAAEGEKTSGVSRCLFGRPDRSDTARVLAEFAGRLRKEAADRWNFDFQASAPLRGRYDWRPTDVRGNRDDDDDDNDDHNDDEDDSERDFACSVPETCGATSSDDRLCHSEAVAASVSTGKSKSSKPCSCSSSSSSSSGAKGISESVLTPNEKQTNCFVRRHLKRLIAAPKKKISALNEAKRRELRQSLTITEYFHVRKQGSIGVRRQLKL